MPTSKEHRLRFSFYRQHVIFNEGRHDNFLQKMVRYAQWALQYQILIKDTQFNTKAM
jgi:hypothetical protein